MARSRSSPRRRSAGAVNIRRRIRAAETLAQSRAAALATLSHELREPLNGLLGMTRLLAEAGLNSEQRGYLDGAIESAETLLTLVNDVLDIARIDAGGLALVEVDFSLPHLIETLRRAIEPRAAAKGLRLEIARAGELTYLRGDPGRLRQALLNLAGNAVKFTTTGRVSLAFAVAREADGAVAFTATVEDTGIGMPPEAQAALHSPFVQADASIARLYGGSGLGLGIARRLLEAMGGSLHCASTPGVGTRFTARCSLRDATRRASGGEGALLERRSLVIADPQPRSRGALEVLARSWKLDVRVAASAREALALLQEAALACRPVDLALVDVGLADNGAFDLAQRIGDDPQLRTTRLVLLAGAGLRGDAGAAHTAGFAAYLPRTTDGDTLRTCLQRLLGGEPQPGLVTVHGIAEQRTACDVLVVDDNALNCRLAQIMLERVGHRVVVVPSGAAALEELLRAPFDVVLMDVQMPEMDGLETARRIRRLADPARAIVPIVAVTANAMAGEAARCRAAGMDGYLTKPVDGPRLAAAVEAMATSRPRVAGPEGGPP